MNYEHKHVLLELIKQWHEEFHEDSEFPCIYSTQKLFILAVEAVTNIFEASADGAEQENQEHTD